FVIYFCLHRDKCPLKGDKMASQHSCKRAECVDESRRMLGHPVTHQCDTDGHRIGPGHRLTFLRMPGVNRQKQAHIVSTAIPLPRSCKAGREVEATPWFAHASFFQHFTLLA